MPGIAGIIGQKPAAECQRLVGEMVASMKHEPFHEAGTYFVPEMGLYAGWTAHTGSFAARHCAMGTREDISLIVSGEWHVETGGSSAKTLYREIGTDFVARLNGLFSGLLIDRPQKRACLFTDRYGLERIYFHETSDGLYFASEAKALLCVLPQLRAFDNRGVAQFLALGCTHGSQTLFRGVDLLEGGNLWLLHDRKRCRQRYFVPQAWEQQSELNASAFDEEFGVTFRRVLTRYVGSGEGVGISLTGGLDTRMIMACLPSLAIMPVSYTFSGQQQHTLDEQLAARVATACGLNHRVLRIGQDFLRDYGQYVDRTVYITDGTFGATGAHEIYLNAQARHLAPVRLTGNFGSEVLRSMSTFKPLELSHQLFQPDFRPLVTTATRNVYRAGDHPVIFSAFRDIPWSLFGGVAAARSQVTLRTPYLDNEIVALACRAPVRTRRSPEPALTLVRRSNPGLGRIPTDRGFIAGERGVAHIMRRVFAEVTFKLDYLHKEGLPHWLSSMDGPLDFLTNTGILGQHKYLPFRRWFQRELREYVTGVVTDPRTARLAFWNSEFLQRMAADHLNGRKNYIREINAVLTLEAVDRLICRRHHSSRTSLETRDLVENRQEM